jgi:hypothetical protein
MDLSDWISIIGSSIIAGVGGAMAWFNSSKNRLHARIDFLEADMRKWDESHADHTTQIAVLSTCQENTSRQLESINVTTRDTNDSVKELNKTITQALLAMQAKKAS